MPGRLVDDDYDYGLLAGQECAAAAATVSHISHIRYGMYEFCTARKRSQSLDPLPVLDMNKGIGFSKEASKQPSRDVYKGVKVKREPSGQ